ncbi:MAG: glycosyltransferase, partial [Acidimicrobiales bacterium]
MSGNRAERHLLAYTDASMVAGAELALATLIEYLPARVKVTVAGSNEEVVRSTAERRPDAAIVITPRLAAKSDLANLPAVRRILLELRPSAIHLNKAEVAGLRYVECLTRTLRRGRPRVVSVIHHVELPATMPGRILSRRLAAGSDAIVAVGADLARQLETILGLPTDRVHAIPNALPPLARTARPAGDRFVVGALTRFVPHKAVGDLISA